jgi:hypothetical protein
MLVSEVVAVAAVSMRMTAFNSKAMKNSAGSDPTEDLLETVN